jgi:hypothetical protein
MPAKPDSPAPAPEPAFPGIVSLEPAPHVLAFLERVLRPLVRVAVSHGVRLGWLVECLKRLLAEEAEALAMRSGERRLPVSTTAMLTGVHRTDVNRLRAQAEAAESPAEPGPSIPSRVLAEWTGSPHTLDEHGWPLPLPRLASVGGELSFEALVKRAYGAVTPRAVLEALVQDGTVRVDEHDVVHCLSVVSGGPRRNANVAERWRANAEVLHDDIAWVAASTGHARSYRQSTRWTVEKRSLSADSVAKARAWYDEEALAFAQRFNALVAELAKADRRRPDAVWRLRMSTSFYFEPEGPLGWCAASDTVASAAQALATPAPAAAPRARARPGAQPRRS